MSRNIKMVYARQQKAIPTYVKYLVILSIEKMRRYSSRSDNLRESMEGG